MTFHCEAFEKTEWLEGPAEAGRLYTGMGLHTGSGGAQNFHNEYHAWEFMYNE